MIFSQSAFTFLIVYGIVGGVVGLTTLVLILFSEREMEYLKVEKRKKDLEVLLIESQLSHLTSQIRPHFLFNALNTVTSLIRIGKYEEAAEAIHGISSLLRHTLRTSHDLISIDEEVNYVMVYLRIQKLRFGSRLNWHVEVDERLRPFKIPVFLIQALVENACKYGIESLAEGGEISLRIWLEGAQLHIEIYNNGPGVDKRIIDAFNRWKEHGIESDLIGIGFKNTQQRLQHYFPNRGDLHIFSCEKGARFRITIKEVV